MLIIAFIISVLDLSRNDLQYPALVLNLIHGAPRSLLYYQIIEHVPAIMLVNLLKQYGAEHHHVVLTPFLVCYAVAGCISDRSPASDRLLIVISDLVSGPAYLLSDVLSHRHIIPPLVTAQVSG